MCILSLSQPSSRDYDYPLLEVHVSKITKRFYLKYINSWKLFDQFPRSSNLPWADPGFFEGGDLGAAEAHLRAPFMHAAHKGCEPSGTGGLGL